MYCRKTQLADFHHPFVKTNCRRNKCGSIIIFVLALIALMAGIMSKFLMETVQDLTDQSLQEFNSESRNLAYSYLELALGVLHEFKELDGTLHSPAQGWHNPLQYAGIEKTDFPVKITIEDESGKIPLATANPQTLNLLFEELDIEFSLREIMTDSLLDWVDEDDLPRLNGAEIDYYEALGYKPSNAPLRSISELSQIRGFDELFSMEQDDPTTVETAAALREILSLYNEGPVNINTAPAPVTQMLSRVSTLDPETLQDYFLGDDRETATGDDRFLTQLQDPMIGTISSDILPIGVEATTLKIIIRIEKGDANYMLSAIVRQNNQGVQGAQSSADGIVYPWAIVKILENQHLN